MQDDVEGAGTGEVRVGVASLPRVAAAEAHVGVAACVCVYVCVRVCVCVLSSVRVCVCE